MNSADFLHYVRKRLHIFLKLTLLGLDLLFNYKSLISMAFVTFIHEVIEPLWPVVKLNYQFLALTFNDFSVFFLRVNKDLLMTVLS